jgi:acyl-CoA thioester hydrolase
MRKALFLIERLIPIVRWRTISYTCTMSNTSELVVRTYECDTYGHVNNANYLHYLEFARHEYLKAIQFDYNGYTAAGYGLFVTRIEIDFKRPALIDDRLTIFSKIIKKGAVSGVMEQMITHGDIAIAQAKVQWAFVDVNGKPCRLPARWNVPGFEPEVQGIS